MDKQAFYKLCDILQGKGLLHHTNRIKIEEQLAIFLFIIGHNLRTRAVHELFLYSGETISRHFNNVLNAIMAISLEFFQPPGPDIPPEILEDPRFYLYFKVKLVVAACALHNYILGEKPDDLIFKMNEHDTVLQMEESLPPLEVEHPFMQAENPALDIAFDAEQLEISSQLRDSIAGDMWDDYSSDLSTI
ncbi:hypothetical protein SADUNF_Sadunf12G0032500 [Salix dunnii]|uniref:DUF8040 domain-containing protein n=1 Tax=Salix dunnii TaxID=1413687 RepID=A0A835JI94_9ROSI|nr:hypothetical protein SADUNF_Sadunf12G0032500 [Salix dunnii]